MKYFEYAALVMSEKRRSRYPLGYVTFNSDEDTLDDAFNWYRDANNGMPTMRGGSDESAQLSALFFHKHYGGLHKFGGKQYTILSEMEKLRQYGKALLWHVLVCRNTEDPDAKFIWLNYVDDLTPPEGWTGKLRFDKSTNVGYEIKGLVHKPGWPDAAWGAMARRADSTTGRAVLNYYEGLVPKVWHPDLLEELVRYWKAAPEGTRCVGLQSNGWHSFKDAVQWDGECFVNSSGENYPCTGRAWAPPGYECAREGTVVYRKAQDER
jgi:hypothetical protein